MNPKGKTVCLLNDSFPPIIDGVSNTILNYASNLTLLGDRALVITPSHPKAADDAFPFPVIRYPSFTFGAMEGYMAGVPFSPSVARTISESTIDLIHCHCPIMSGFLARSIRHIKPVPLITTYHTKFNIDIENVVKTETLQNACKKVLSSNLRASDEVWAVSRGAGENTRTLGYEGDYIVMPNGVDLPHERVFGEKVAIATAGYDLPEEIPVFLFVGRMMWYKGIRIILDALSHLQENGKDFRMVLIGSGDDLEEIKNHARLVGVRDKCIFTGAIRNRETLRAWYGRADLFLFPSTYDTNGLVVREAAANDLASVLIRGSCAAEDVSDGKNGFLIDENAESMAKCLTSLYNQRETVRTTGKAAGEQLYISWKDAVHLAKKRYEKILEKHQINPLPKKTTASEGIMKINAELMEALAKLNLFRK